MPKPPAPPRRIKPQLTRLVEEAPTGKGWLHEIKYDGYRLHARIDGKRVALLTRTGLDWTHRYRRTAAALSSLKLGTGGRGRREGYGRRCEASWEPPEEAFEEGSQGLGGARYRERSFRQTSKPSKRGRPY